MKITENYTDMTYLEERKIHFKISSRHYQKRKITPIVQLESES